MAVDPASAVELTDWIQIAGLYALLSRLHPSPVVTLNHAVAVPMADGAPGLELLSALDRRGDLEHYHLFHAARADLLRRANLRVEAQWSYRRALELVSNDSERRYLQRRMRELE